VTKQSEEVAHSELVAGSITSLHSHSGGGGGGLVDKGGEVITNGNGEASISFNTSYGSTNYFILLTPIDPGDGTLCMVKSGTKTVNGFTVETIDDSGKAETGVTVMWATGLYSNP